MISELREEQTKAQSKVKKDLTTSQKKQNDDIDKVKAEMDVLHAKTSSDFSLD